MEEARRRLAVFSSHIRPVAIADLHRERFSGVSASTCSSSSIGTDDQNQARVSGEEDVNLDKRCVFCRIIKGESPAYKIRQSELHVSKFQSHFHQTLWRLEPYLDCLRHGRRKDHHY